MISALFAVAFLMAFGSLLLGLSGQTGANGGKVWDHVWRPGQTSVDSGNSSNAYDGTASAGCSIVSNGLGGDALRIPAGDSFALGTAADVDLGTANYVVEARIKYGTGVKSGGAGLLSRTNGTWSTNDRSVFVDSGGGLSIQLYGLTGVSIGIDDSDDTWRVYLFRVNLSATKGRRAIFERSELFVDEDAWGPSADSAHAPLHIGPISGAWSGPLDVDYVKYRRI